MNSLQPRFGRVVRSRLADLGKKKPSKKSVTEALDGLMNEDVEDLIDEKGEG